MTKRSAGLVPAIVLLIATAAVAGCGKNDSLATPQAAPTSAAGLASSPVRTTSPPVSSGAAGDDIAKVAQALQSARSFRGQITSELPSQAPRQSTVEYVAPDKYHLVLGSGSEFISIGADSYIKAGDTWTKAPGGGIGQIFDPKTINAALDSLAGYTKGGTDTVNGRRCQRYTNTSPATGGTQEICIGDNNLPVRFVGTLSGTKTTIIYSDFNGNIDIKAPI